MGNASSGSISSQQQGEEDVWWTNGERNSYMQKSERYSFSESNNSDVFQESAEHDEERLLHRKELTEDLNVFKQELARKHEKRRIIIAEKRKEMQDLRDELEKQKQENEKLKQMLSSKEHSETYVGSKEDRGNVDNNVSEELNRFKEDAESRIQKLIDENNQLRNTVEELRVELVRGAEIADKNKELRISITEMQNECQRLNNEMLSFEEEREDYRKHVIALKDVIKVSKDLLKIRENQINELRQKITDIEQLLAEKESEMLAENLKQEYERQLGNIRNLKVLYEERQLTDRREKQSLNATIEELKQCLVREQEKFSESEERIKELEEENSKRFDKICNLESNLGLAKADCRDLRAEMAVVNQLFSQILMDFNNCQEVDLVKMTKTLEENHDLLTDIAVKEESNEVSSALPKTLLDLIKQVNDIEKQRQLSESSDGNIEIKQITDELDNAAQDETETQTTTPHQLNSAEEIVENLPKVWKVLIELLSQQSPPNNIIIEENEKDSENPCYKSVQTPSGTKLVLSVSKTFIRLKDLILEKKFLEKEMSRMKHLNGHLENRLQDQEKRLEMVSSELSKTWHFVGKMQRQHQQLHTHEKVLRYELSQKRKLLTELKEELEDCREKWIQAREKNSSTEEQWKQLRTEFASRKNTVDNDLNNSVESGYSDEKSSSDSDDHDDDDNGTTEDKENLEKLEESTVDTDNSTILDVVKTEIANIESIFEEKIEETNKEKLEATQNCDAANNEDNHSVLKSEKTDLVQSSEEERQTAKINSSNQEEPICALGVAQDLVQEENTNLNTQIELNKSENSTDNPEKPKRTIEEMFAARDARLKRLEEQSQQLVTKVTNTSHRSVAICNKLENLHELYGESSTSNSRQSNEVSPDKPSGEQDSPSNNNK